MILERFTHLLNRTVFENKYSKCLFIISSVLYKTYITCGARVLKGWNQNCAMYVKLQFWLINQLQCRLK